MTSQGGSAHANDDGVRIVRTAGARRLPWLIAAVVAVPIVVTILAVVVIRASAPAAKTSPAAAPGPAPVAVAVASTDPPAPERSAAPTAPARERVVPRRVVTAPVADRPPQGGVPTPSAETSPRELDAGDAILALREEGIHTGIAAFGLPGSNPPKPGIIVPDDFPLPEGYVRHYQTTDDGEQLPAILMFHPDYEFLNARGEVVKVPDDLVVPPEMAPPGLDVDRVLEVPERKAGEPVH